MPTRELLSSYDPLEHPWLPIARLLACQAKGETPGAETAYTAKLACVLIASRILIDQGDDIEKVADLFDEPWKVEFGYDPANMAPAFTVYFDDGEAVMVKLNDGRDDA